MPRVGEPHSPVTLGEGRRTWLDGWRSPVGIRARRCIVWSGALVTAAVAVMLAVVGCGTTAQGQHVPPACSRPATACANERSYAEASHAGWAQLLGSLGGLAIPVYLPTWSPPSTALTQLMCSGRSLVPGLNSYVATVSLGSCGGSGNTSSAGPQGSVGARWTVAGSSVATTTDLAPTGSPRSVGLPHAIVGTLYGGGGQSPVLDWMAGGWHYQLAGSPAQSSTSLAEAAAQVIATVGVRGRPVPGVESGTVVDQLTPGGPAVAISWSGGQWQYLVEGPGLSTFACAQSLVEFTVSY